jgi:putative ABC transport system permease protein
MLIALYLEHEFTYDQHYTNSDRLYRVGTEFHIDGRQIRTLSTAAPTGPMLKHEFPEIEATARTLSLFVDDKTLLQYSAENETARSFYETKGYMADSTFFRVFNFEFTEGNGTIALDDPNTVVLSAEIAYKFFGNTPALNKVIRISSSLNGTGDYKISGVFKPGPHPTHLDGRFFISTNNSGYMGNYIKSATTGLTGGNIFNTYVLLKPGTDVASLEKKFPAFIEKYMGKDLRAMGGKQKEFLTAIKDIHLRSNTENFIIKDLNNGNLTYLYILASVAVFILLIACINFMNLATARSAKRAAEVGIRKVLGAERNELIRQFLGESMLFTMVSFLLAIGLTKLLLPLFSSVSGISLQFNFEQQGWLLAGFAGLTIITGLLAGSYPALYLSSFRPIKVLKGRFANTLSAITLRKALVVFQFTISAALIIAAFAIGKQMNFMRTTDLGFTKDQQIVIPLRTNNAKRIQEPMKAAMLKNGATISAGSSWFYPGMVNPNDFKLYMPGKTNDDGIIVKSNIVDKSFLQTLEMRPVAGRLFSEAFTADTFGRIVLNESAIKRLGFKDAGSAVGKQVLSSFQGRTDKYEIIGIVKDFNYEGLQSEIIPYCFHPGTGRYNYLITHAKPGNLQSLLQYMEKEWNRLNPNEPFEYSVLDQDFQKNYEAENRLSDLIRYFMIIAITICCLGLFGLAAFSAEQRTKEIGIRKVLGSSVTGIIGLLSKDFMKLVILGNIIALPIAWYMMHQWLQEFAYRTALSWWVFAAAIVLSAIIALLTVGYQAIRSALANPVKSLRTE